jgi:hypothetical protein
MSYVPHGFEINTLGAAEASKFLTVNSDIDVASGLRNLTATGYLQGTISLRTALIQYTDGDDAITIADGGGVTMAAGITSTAVSNTFGATSFNDANITNVGNIALDSISADDTDINLALTDASATAFTIKQGTDAYLIVDTGDGSESVSIGTGISGTAITIGHATSEVTIGDNLTITGNLTVSGDTVTQNVATVLVEDPLMLLAHGQTGSGGYDAGLIVERGDDTNVGIIWDETADEFSVINTASTATEAGNVTIASYAAFQSAALTASTGTFSGILKTDNATDATTTTDGALRTAGGLSVVLDCIFGNDVKLLTNSSVFAMGVGSDFTITHDGTTGVTLAGNPITITSGGAATWSTSAGALTIDAAAAALTLDGHTGVTVQSSNSGDITLDSVAAINIDAGTGVINFQDSGSTVLSLTESGSGDVTVKLVTNAKDLIFTDNGDAEGFRIHDGAVGVSVVGDVRFAERADHAQTPGAGYGQLWVKNEAANCELYFTTDNGNDIQLTDGASIAGGGGVADSVAADDISAGDGAVNITTSIGNITLATQATDTDIILKVNDGGSVITALTLDGSEDGAATFKSTVTATTSVKATTIFCMGVQNSAADVNPVTKGFTDIDASGDNRTVTLPTGAAGSIGNMYTIKKVDSSSNTVTITTSSTPDDKIDGGNSMLLYHQYESITVIYAATNKYYVM